MLRQPPGVPEGVIRVEENGGRGCAELQSGLCLRTPKGLPELELRGATGRAALVKPVLLTSNKE